MTAIATRALTKIYKRPLGRPSVPSLDDLNLDVGENEVFGFLGRNGAGKTTTIKLLCSLLHQTRGEALILGKSARTPEARRSVGYLPEDPYFYEYLTPKETLDFYGRLQGMSALARKDEWEKLSVLLDLAGIAGQRIREFSKGMRQRLGFAVALVGDPAILILDEPMSGLDPLGRRAMREIILELRCQRKTIFFSSHVLGDVEQICDRVGILVKGRLTVQGRLDQLLTSNIEQVEVIASGLDPKAVPEIGAKAVSSRVSEAGDHFLVADLDTANEVVRMIHARGAGLVEFTPIKESLEDYFMRKQEPHS
jgi:ABC-2 type transport system ATP-binding protein